jgi:hypothetical protein
VGFALNRVPQEEEHKTDPIYTSTWISKIKQLLPPGHFLRHHIVLLPTTKMMFSIASVALLATSASAFTSSSFSGSKLSNVPRSTSALDMKYKVAVVGGGPSGACAAEIFAQEKGIDTVLFERKLDNAKPCGGAIPLCMIGEFDLPETVVDRKVCLDCPPFLCFVRLVDAMDA